MDFAIVFPGQNSQSLKMEDNLQHIDVVRSVFNTAQKVLGVDFLAMLQEESPENINNTVNTQPLMLTAGYASYKLLLAKNNNVLQTKVMAGHSLGEWTALVASGAIRFEDALELVRLRAIAMQEAVPIGVGAMSAIIGLDDAMIIDICTQISAETKEIVAPANFNSVGQVVIAGNTRAVELASALLKDSGAKKVQMLSVSVPAHCSLMMSASEKLRDAIADVTVEMPKVPVIHNIDGSISENIASIKAALVKQLYSPVQWTKTIKTISKSESMGITNIIECGPGKVLTGLNKRINPKIVSYNLHKEADFGIRL